MNTFQVLNDWSDVKRSALPAGFYLLRSNWDDFRFKTTFHLYYTNDDFGYPVEIGNIKIGYSGQDEGSRTYDKIPKRFGVLPDNYFSLAESPEFYDNLYNRFGEDAIDILKQLNCVVTDSELFNRTASEMVFGLSLMRDVNIVTINNQFKRILSGDDKVKRFEFDFIRKGHKYSDLNLSFIVEPTSLPHSNIHAIIGRNGLGKTTLLNEMVSSLVAKSKPAFVGFYEPQGAKIDSGYFSTVISVSFSAFDPFTPFSEQSDQKKGTCYYYIGLKEVESEGAVVEVEDKTYSPLEKTEIIKEVKEKKVDKIASLSELREKYAQSVKRCFSDSAKKALWLDSISKLDSDTNFEALKLSELASLSEGEILPECISRMEKMSSGHAVVFMTISRLVEVLQERTLILFDEPESHLHPPLLSAFIRSLSKLLSSRNGVAIMATHSPVVIQELPQSCCWILTRFGDVTTYARPEIETFAENIGVLTKEIFNFEVENSGFHKLFQEKVSEGHSLDDIIDMFDGNIGQEGLAILMVMVTVRDRKSQIGGQNA